MENRSLRAAIQLTNFLFGFVFFAEQIMFCTDSQSLISIKYFIAVASCVKTSKLKCTKKSNWNENTKCVWQLYRI